MSRKSLPDGDYYLIHEISDSFAYRGVFPLWRDFLVLRVDLKNDKGMNVWVKVVVKEYIFGHRSTNKNLSVDYRTLFKTKNEVLVFIFKHGSKT